MLRVAEVTLVTMTVFVPWASVDVLFQDDNILLQALFVLLGIKDLRLHGINCLCAMLERKVCTLQEVFMVNREVHLGLIVHSPSHSCLSILAKLPVDSLQMFCGH